MLIKITAKKHGFRRCGVAHTATPVIYQDGFFSQQEIDILKAEPALLVEIVEEPSVSPDTDDDARKIIDATMTVKKLEKELAKMGVALPARYTKADLVELIVKHTAEAESGAE